MAEIREEILLDIRLEKADNDAQVDTLTSRITNLKKETADLVTTNKALAKSGQDNSKEYLDNTKQIEINKQKIGENTASRKNLITTIIAEDNSIKALTVRNRELVKQRNEISTATVEGRAKIAILNKEIDKNNETIRVNNDALGKQKINIGNYTSALDGLIPGLGGVVRGTQAMTVASKAFIATPIGAIIGALGLALGALMAYFKGSEEGQNRLNKIMNIGGAIMEKIMDVVEGLGETIFEAFDNPKQAVSDLMDFLGENFLNRIKAFAVIWEGITDLDFEKVYNGTIQLTTGITNMTGKLKEFGSEISKQAEDALKRAAELSKIQEASNKKERDLIIQRAQIDRDVARLRVEAQEEEGQARLDKFNQAIDLEKKLLAAEQSLADTRLALAKHAVEDDPTIENKKAYAEAVAGQINAETAFFEGIRKLNQQRVTLEDEIQKERLDKYTEHLEAEHEIYLAAKEKRDEARLEEEEMILRFEERIAKETEARKKAQEDQVENTKKANANLKKISDLKRKSDESDLAAFADGLGQASTLFKEGTAEFKIAATAQALINTYLSASKAFASAGNPILGAILAAIAVAAGLMNVAKINAVQLATGGKVPGYASGGLSGTRIMEGHGSPINRPNGDNRLATVRVGEVILNENQQRALGGDRTFRNIGVPGFIGGGFTGNLNTTSATRRIEQALNEQNIASLINKVNTVLVLQDFEAAESAKNSPENRAQVIS